MELHINKDTQLCMSLSARPGNFGRPAIWELAQGRLVIPSGFGRLWWGIRTQYAPPGVLRRRLALLRECLTSGLASSSFLTLTNPLG